MGVISNFKAVVGLQDNTRAGTQSVVANLNRISRALDVTHLAATRTFQIDKSIRSVGVQAGLAAVEIAKTERTIVKLANATGHAAIKTAELAAAFMAAGQVMPANSRQLLGLMRHFDLTADQLVEVNASVSGLRLNFTNLTDSIVDLQSRYRVAGMFHQLPKVLSYAQRAITQFSTTSVGNADRIIKSLIETGATYAKVYGIDLGRAIDMATQQHSAFSSAVRHDQDMYLGLEEGLSGLSMALIEGTGDFARTQQLLRMGQDDPVRYAESIMQMRDSMEEAFGTGYAERFFRNVVRSSDEATAALLNNRTELAKAIAARQAADREQRNTKSFGDLLGQMEGIGSVIVDTISNLTHLGKTIIGLAFIDDVTEAFKGIIPTLQRFNDLVLDTADTIRDSETFQKIKPILQGIGRVLIGVGAAAGMVASTFASAVIPFNTFINIFSSLPLIGGATPLLVRLGDAVAHFTKQTFRSVGILGGMAIALNDFGQALKNPYMGSMEIILRGFRAMAVGVVEIFDGMLGGIPTKIARYFLPQMRGSLGDAVRGLFRDLQLMLSTGTTTTVQGWWSKIKEATNERLEEFKNWLNGNFDRFNLNAQTWGENIGRAIGSLARWAIDAIQPLFSASTWSGWFTSITQFLKGEGGPMFTGALGEILNQSRLLVNRFTTAMFDEMLRPFGMGMLEVQLKFYDMWDAFRVGIDWMQNIGWPTMQSAWLEAKIGIVTFTDTAIESFMSVKNAAQTAWDYIKGAALTAIGPIGAGVQLLVGTYESLKLAMLGAAYALSYLEDPTGSKGTREMLSQKISQTEQAISAASAARGQWTDMTAEGMGLILAAPDMASQRNASEENRRRAARSATDQMLAADRARKSGLDSSIVASQGSHEQFVASVGANKETRDAQARAEIAQREATRASEDAANRNRFAELERIRGPLMDQARQILQFVEGQRDSVSGNGEGAQRARRNASVLADNLRDVTRAFVDVQDPAVAIQLWGNVMGQLRSAGILEKVAQEVGFSTTEMPYDRGRAPAVPAAPPPPPPPSPVSQGPAAVSGQRLHVSMTIHGTDEIGQVVARNNYVEVRYAGVGDQ